MADFSSRHVEAAGPPASHSAAQSTMPSSVQTSSESVVDNDRPRPRFAPTKNLVLAAALVLLPPALLETVAPEFAVVLVIFAAVLALVAIGDLVAALNRARGTNASLRPLTRVSLGRESALEGELRTDDTGPRHVQAGLVAPAELGLEVAEADVPFPEGKDTGRVRVQWRIRPWRRGSYRLDEMHLQLRLAVAVVARAVARACRR